MEVEPKNPDTAAYLENHVAQATWKAFVVECKEDYDKLYREIREKRGIAINIIIVDRVQSRDRLYSNERMNVLRREHGFEGYLDETFTAPAPIMQALVNKHNVDKVLVGGEGVLNSLERKDLIEFLSSREANDGRPGKQSSCFFFSYKGDSFKYTNQVSRYSGQIGTNQDNITKAVILRPGVDPNVKKDLARTIEKADECLARLQPVEDAANAIIEEKQKEGQDIYQNGKEAKQTKSDYTQWQGKLENQRAKLQEAEEEADKDNDSEKAKRVAKMKKHVKNSIAMAEQAGELHDQIMKGTRTLTGVKMTDDALNESLRHLV